MSKNLKVEQTLVSKALTAAAAVERGQYKLHLALIDIVSFIALGGNGDFTPLTKYVQARRSKNPKGNVTLGVELWVSKVLKLSIGKDDGVVRKNKKNPVTIDQEWVDGAKAKPWYDVVSDALEFKVPGVSYVALASTWAKREYLGDTLPEELKAFPDFMDEFKDYKIGDKFMAWKVEADARLADGRLSRLN